MKQWLLDQVDEFLNNMTSGDHLAKLNAKFIEAQAAKNDLLRTLERLELRHVRKQSNEELVLNSQ